jgi:hypothetical protein
MQEAFLKLDRPGEYFGTVIIMKGTSKSPIAVVAYVSALLFVVHFLGFFILRHIPVTPLINVLDTMIGVLAHALLFPVITNMSGPAWAKNAGIGWLVVDTATEIMGLNGVSPVIYLSMRYGGHVCAAIWMAGCAYSARGAYRAVGLLVSIVLGGYSFVSPYLSIVFVFPILLFVLPWWLVLVGRQIALLPKGK